MLGLPYAVAIEPTNRCNLRCPECPTGNGTLTRAEGRISLSDFQLMVNHLPKEVFYLSLYFQGEPFLHPELGRLISIAKQKRRYVVVATNGHYLDEKNVDELLASGLDEIIIALDGAHAESYEQYRTGGDFEAVLQGISRLVKNRRQSGSDKPLIRIQSLLLRSNENETEQIRMLGKSLGVDVIQYKKAQFLHLPDNSKGMPERESLRRYTRNVSGEWVVDHKLNNRCFQMWSRCVVTWEGKVLPCCYDKDANWILGDLRSSALKEIWKSRPYLEFRKKLSNNRREIEMCRNCAEGMRVTIPS